MLRILIVEDEALVARRLRRMLESLLGDEGCEIRMCSGFGSARELLKKETIDLLFLDLNLHGKDGFALLEEAVAGPFDTVIVSANTDRAIQAFDYGVLDFVPKPFGRARLEKALDRFRQRPKDRAAEVLAVRHGGGIEMIRVGEIVAIHGADNYAEIEMKSGRKLLHDKRLDHLENILPQHFVRVHRSHIIDWREVVRLEAHRGSRYTALLKSGTRVPVSRRKVAELRNLSLG